MTHFLYLASYLLLNKCTQLSKEHLSSMVHQPSWKNTCLMKQVSYEGFWRYFYDLQIDLLVAYALKNNLQLQIAKERIVEARAVTGGIRTGLFPQVNLTTQGQNGTPPLLINQTESITGSG